MCKILPRIKEIALNEGITIGALERIIGASKGVLSRAIANGTDIQSKWLEAIVENYPQYSAQWILTGVGSMLNESTTPKADTSSETQTDNNQQSQATPPDGMWAYLKDKDLEIGKLHEEVGHLKTRVAQLERELAEARAFTPQDSPEFSETYKQRELSTT